MKVPADALWLACRGEPPMLLSPLLQDKKNGLSGSAASFLIAGS